MDIERFVKSEIRVINATLAAHRVNAGTLPSCTVVAGAAFISYQIKMGEGVRVAAIERLQAELSEAISRHRNARTPVRLRYMPLALEAPHPDPRPLLWSKARMDWPAHTLLAGRSYGYDGAVEEWVSLESTPHVLIGGMTGAGKSVLLNMLLLSLMRGTSPAEVSVILVDLKNEDLRPLARLPHVVRFAGTVAQAAAAIEQVHAETQERIRRHGSGQRLVLAIDEYAQLVGHGDVVAQLEQILGVGRSLRVNVLAATQHPTAKVLGSLAKVNFPCRLIGQVSDPGTASVATGRPGTGAEQLPGKGAFLRVQGPDVTRLQAYYLDSAGLRFFRHEVLERWGDHVDHEGAKGREGARVPAGLAEVFGQYSDGAGGLARGGLAAAMRALLGPGAPTAGGRAYQEAAQQIQEYLAAWNAAQNTSSDTSSDTSGHASGKASGDTSARGGGAQMVIRGSMPRLVA